MIYGKYIGSYAFSIVLSCPYTGGIQGLDSQDRKLDVNLEREFEVGYY